MVEGKSIVVIGATSGIGAATARLLVANGASVVFAGRRIARGEALATELGPAASFQRADITVEADVAALIDLTLARHGRLDGLINCAGESLPGTALPAIDVSEFEGLVAATAGGALSATKHAALAMLPRKAGSIVHISSIAGHYGGWSGIAYSAAKAAVLQLTRSAAVELGEEGIRVNSISPGPIITGMFAKATGVDAVEADTMTAPTAEFAAAGAPWQPMPGAGQPGDVASAAVWLVGDAARFVNGVDVALDGGISAGRPASVGMSARATLAAAFKREASD